MADAVNKFTGGSPGALSVTTMNVVNTVGDLPSPGSYALGTPFFVRDGRSIYTREDDGGTPAWQVQTISGTEWLTGSGAPASGLGAVGNLYLDTAVGDYYKKTGATTWTIQGNLKGADGAPGADGDPGPEGPAGEAGADGDAGAGVPAGGVEFDLLEKASATANDTRWATPLAALIERVAGVSGFQNVSGAVTIDLAAGRNHFLNVTGNVTSVDLANVPSVTVSSPDITLAIKFADPGHVFSSFLLTETLVWIDGRSITDLDKTGLVNLVGLKVVGTEIHAAILWNGTLEREEVAFPFLANATLKYPTLRPTIWDPSDAEVDGAGTVVYAKDGTPITVATSFARGEVFSVTAEAGQSITVPRYWP